MGFWFTFFLWAASFVLTDYFRQRLPNREASGIGDFTAPTATQGRPVPQVVGGTVRIEGTNCVWFGDWDAEPVTVETGIIFKRDETVGYKYRIAAALGQFMGRCAGMTAIYIGDDRVWNHIDDNAGAVATVVDVSLPDLFGGEKSGGGFIGRFRCFTGEDGQAVSSFLQARIPDQSAWPGFTYVMMTDLAETGGALIGEQNQMRDIRIEFQTYDTSGLGNELGLTSNRHIIGRDANPIACAYRLLTDPDWSVSSSVVNAVNFQTAANTCHAEGLGFSMTVDTETETFAIIAEIEKHIDGYIGQDPITGLIEVKLARDDYTPAAEFQADESNILAVSDFAKPDWPQTKNDVKVRFVNRDASYSDDHATAQDMANRIITGRPSAMTLRFPGVRDAAVANQIVARTSRAYFWPLSKFQLEMDRTAELLRPGDVMIVTHPDIPAVDLACRITRVRTGDALKQSIKIDVVEDVFKVETGLQANPPGTEFIPPDPAAVNVTTYAATLSPRWLLERNNQDPNPRIIFLAARDAPNTRFSVAYRSRDNFGSGSFTADTIELGPAFAKFGTLRAALGFMTDTVNSGLATLAEGGAFDVDGADLADLAGTYDIFGAVEGIAVINPGAANEEFVAIQSVAVSGIGIACTGVVRGIGDTPIYEHALGEPVFFLEGAYVSPSTAIDDTDGFQFKVAGVSYAGTQDFGTLSYSGEIQVIDRNLAPITPVTMTYRLADGGWQANYFPPGPWPVEADNINTPTKTALAIRGLVGDPLSLNPVYRADGRDDAGATLGADWSAGYGPQLNYWIYDLDKTPTPVRADAVISGVRTGTLVDGRQPEVEIDVSEFRAYQPEGGTLNARIEVNFEHTIALNGLPTAREGRSLFVDRDITFAPDQDSYGAYENTVIYLKGDGFDGTNQFIDYGPHNHTVTPVGGAVVDAVTAPDTGLPQGVIRLGDGSKYLSIPDHPSMNISDTEGYLVQMRIMFPSNPPTTSSGFRPLLAKYLTAGSQQSFYLAINNDDWWWGISTTGANLLTEVEDSAFSAGVWYDLSMQVIPNSTSFFVGGVLDDRETGSNGTPFDSTTPLLIGADSNGGIYPGPLLLDQIRITRTKSVLSPFTKLTKEWLGREVDKPFHFQFDDATAGFGVAGGTYNGQDLSRIPLSLSSQAGTFIDDAQTAFAGGKSLACGGVNGSNANANNSDGAWIAGSEAGGIYNPLFDVGLRDFTIEAFVRFAALPSTNPNEGAGMCVVSSAWRTGATPWVIFDFWFPSSNELSFFWVTPGGADQGSTLDSSTFDISAGLALNTWYHVAVCRKDGVASLYFNGDRVDQKTDWGNAKLSNFQNGRVAVARHYARGSGGTRHKALNGWIDEVRFLNGTAAYDGVTYTIPSAPLPIDPPPQDPPPPPPVPANASNWQPTNL